MRVRFLLLSGCLALALWAGGAAGPARAIDASEILPDPALELRAREVSKGLRCLVCQNQSIFDSNSGLAKDLRVVVRERVVAGDSDQEILDFVSARYGDYVLLEPPVKASTAVLWIGPLVIVGVGAALVLGYHLSRRRRQPVHLDPQARAEAQRLLRGDRT
jgi:cytochrome c-type biogenesis protein CcmH